MTDAPAAPPTTTPPSREDIAVRAQEWKVLFLAQNLGMESMFRPELPLLQTSLRTANLPSDGDFPVHLMHGTHDGDGPRERWEFSARQILTAATTLRGDILRDYMSTAMLGAAVRLNDMVKMGGFHSYDEPLLEFLRHYRNACAHGDRWHFTNKEPSNEARCRDVHIKRDMHDQRATWNTISPRLHVEFLDDITNYFVPGLIPAPRRAD